MKAALLLALLTSAFPASGAAQASGNAGEAGVISTAPRDPEAMPRPSARAARTDLPVILDGVLDDEAWGEADPISGFVQSMPVAGAPATEETVVRVLYDNEYLYVGALEDALGFFEADPVLPLVSSVLLKIPSELKISHASTVHTTYRQCKR